MASTRLDILKNMVAQRPEDSFLRYGLAMEYRNSGDLQQAMDEFNALMAAAPDYVPAYFHAGQTLEQLGRPEDAAAVYRRGIDEAARKGDQHARSELEGALALLG